MKKNVNRKKMNLRIKKIDENWKMDAAKKKNYVGISKNSSLEADVVLYHFVKFDLHFAKLNGVACRGQ